MNHYYRQRHRKIYRDQLPPTPFTVSHTQEQRAVERNTSLSLSLSLSFKTPPTHHPPKIDLPFPSSLMAHPTTTTTTLQQALISLNPFPVWLRAGFPQ
mmetsp:Transcript_395/g.644  ORF Transcript_395/g.644 Transcript_395/m.644 type:complete len:98 (-) Transcript_395:3834-4127(-)